MVIPPVGPEAKLVTEGPSNILPTLIDHIPDVRKHIFICQPFILWCDLQIALNITRKNCTDPTSMHHK